MVLVAAAALLRGSELLCAQRSAPPELAGLWEFPGGKVEDGEEPLRRASGVSTGPESAGEGEHAEPTPAGRNGDEALPLYEFEPSPEAVLDALLPQFATNLIYTSLLDAAASEWAARRRAMKSATDNAGELQESLTREANAARQAEITQEISEIVGGADALAAARAE